MTAHGRRGKRRLIIPRIGPDFSWGKLTILTVVAVVLVYETAISAVANITRRKNPDVALSVVSLEPIALTVLAERRFLASQTPKSIANVERLAKQALMQQPLNAAAVRLLGYIADLRGNRKEAAKRVVLSTRIRRRDFGAQLWLIEAAVQEGKTAIALQHYDIALRTTLDARPILFPTLTDALADPDVRSALVPYVRKAPNWMSAFLYEAIANSENPENIAAVLIAAGQMPPGDDYREIARSLLSRLATKYRFDSFQRYYTSLPNANPVTLKSVGLNSATVNLRYPPAGWQIADSAAVGGGFAEKKAKGKFRFNAFAGSGERGIVMQKYLFLKPGTYRLFAEHSAIESAPEAGAEWIVQCLANEVATGIGTMSSPVIEGKFTTQTTFEVSPRCPTQILLLRVSGGSGQSGAEFTVENIALTR